MTGKIVNIVRLQPGFVKESMRMAPVSKLKESKFFKKLDPKVQAGVIEETEQFVAALRTHGIAGLSVGQHLVNLQELLQPQKGRPKKGEEKNFKRYLSTFNFTVRTAYRYIATYKKARETFPSVILEAAAASGVRLITMSEDRPFGAFTDAVKILPPPQHTNEEGAKRYLVQLEHTRRERMKRMSKRRKKSPIIIEGDPDTIVKEIYRFTKLRLERIAGQNKTKVRYFEQAVGMTLTNLGISHLNIHAVAVPEDVEAKRGRPKTKEEDQPLEATQSAAAAS